jgi:hypothetical protein
MDFCQGQMHVLDVLQHFEHEHSVERIVSIRQHFG